MSFPTYKGFLGEEIPSYEEFSMEEKLLPLNFNLIINSVSSLPLYERLDFKKESLCEDELKVMNAQAKRYDDFFKLKVPKNIENDTGEISEEELRNMESQYSEDEENVEIFLKHIYNCSEDDELIIRLKQNISFDGVLQNSTNEVQSFDGSKTCTPSKEFSEFLLNTNDGIHDDFVIRKNVSSQESCSDDSSEEKDEVTANIAKELSHKLKFSESSNTKSLDHILNANKPDTFKMISESTSKKPILQIQNMFHSESESENEIDPPKKTQICKDDETSKELLSYRGRKGKRSRRKIKPKANVKECNTNAKKNENRIEVMKTSKDKIVASHSHCSTGSCTNMRGFDQHKPLEENIANRQSAINKTGTELLPNAKVGIQKKFEKTKKHNETSDSSDEDWQDLAEKNLYLRSKTLVQKATIKK